MSISVLRQTSTMKVLALLLLVIVCVTAQDIQNARGRLANIDVDKVLSNERVLKSYVNCFLDKGPCTPEGRDGKKILPQMYFENCEKCSADEKTLMKKAVNAFISKRKDDWKAIVDKYDPEHKHEEEFLKWIKEQ